MIAQSCPSWPDSDIQPCADGAKPGTAKKVPAEEQAGLRACSKAAVGRKNASYLTYCYSQR